METINKTFSPKEITEMHRSIIRSYISGNITIEEYFNEIKFIENMIQ